MQPSLLNGQFIVRLQINASANECYPRKWLFVYFIIQEFVPSRNPEGLYDLAHLHKNLYPHGIPKDSTILHIFIRICTLTESRRTLRSCTSSVMSMIEAQPVPKLRLSMVDKLGQRLKHFPICHLNDAIVNTKHRLSGIGSVTQSQDYYAFVIVPLIVLS